MKIIGEFLFIDTARVFVCVHLQICIYTIYYTKQTFLKKAFFFFSDVGWLNDIWYCHQGMNYIHHTSFIISELSFTMLQKEFENTCGFI